MNIFDLINNKSAINALPATDCIEVIHHAPLATDSALTIDYASAIDSKRPTCASLASIIEESEIDCHELLMTSADCTIDDWS